jgi:hypothetical protein
MNDYHLRETLRSIAEEEVPTTVDLWPAVRNSIQRRTRQWVHLAAATVVLLAAVSLFVWIAQPRAANAAQIVERAQAATADPATAGIESFALTHRMSRTSLGRWLPPDAKATEADMETIIRHGRFYFQAPNLRRGETTEVEIIRGENAFGAAPRSPMR